jgi:hypothetical protein
MDEWLTCFALAPWCLFWKEKILLCIVQEVEPSKLVGNTVSCAETVRPVVENAGDASFSHGVMRKSSNPDVCRCTGGYGIVDKWARGQRARRVDGVCFSCGYGDKLAKVVNNRMLQRGVCFNRGDQDGQVSFELMCCLGSQRWRDVQGIPVPRR